MNKTKKNNIVFWILFGGCLLFVLYIVFTFELFDDKPTELVKFDSDSDKYKLAIYYIPSNTSHQDYIQIRKIYSDRTFYVVQSFERYQILKKYTFLNNQLHMVLSDTTSYRPRQDTIVVDITH